MPSLLPLILFFTIQPHLFPLNIDYYYRELNSYFRLHFETGTPGYPVLPVVNRLETLELCAREKQAISQT